MSSIPVIDTLLSSLSSICEFHKTPFNAQDIRQKFAVDESFITPKSLMLAAKSLGLKCGQVKAGVDRLNKMPLPAIAMMKNGQAVVLGSTNGEQVAYLDYAEGRAVTEGIDEFEGKVSGVYFLFASRESLVGGLAKFDLSWFIPSIFKYRNT